MLRAPYIPSGPTPQPEVLPLPRIVRFIGNAPHFTHVFHGVRVGFYPDEKYGGQKVSVIDRKDVLHTLLLIGRKSGDPQFEIAEDLERLADMDAVLDVIKENPKEVAELIFPHIVELANAQEGETKEAPKPKRKRRTKAEIEADNLKPEGDDQ